MPLADIIPPKDEMWCPMVYSVGSYSIVYVPVYYGSKYVDIYVGGSYVDRYHIRCYVDRYVYYYIECFTSFILMGNAVRRMWTQMEVQFWY